MILDVYVSAWVFGRNRWSINTISTKTIAIPAPASVHSETACYINQRRFQLKHILCKINFHDFFVSQNLRKQTRELLLPLSHTFSANSFKDPEDMTSCWKRFTILSQDILRALKIFAYLDNTSFQCLSKYRYKWLW